MKEWCVHHSCIEWCGLLMAVVIVCMVKDACRGDNADRTDHELEMD